MTTRDTVPNSRGNSTWRGRLRLLALFAIMIAISASAAPAKIALVRDGEARAVVVVGEEDGAAADLLVATIAKSTGATLPARTSSPVDTATVAIHVGRTALVAERLAELGVSGLDRDGFVITFPEERTVVIAGSSTDGTFHGVCEFLERFLGVRWLFPGESGEHVPKHASLAVPTVTIREEPAFLMRFMYWSQRQSESNTRDRILIRRAWRRRMRSPGTQKRVSFNHFMFRIIRPTQFGKTHPKFFPIQKGERKIPATDTPHHWEPCFTAPGLVEASVASLCRYFDGHPDKATVSLAVNDNGGHCECERCMAMDGGERTEFNYPNRSRSYFTWADQVAKGVLAKHPGKLFGCLAYREVSTPPPGMKLNPAIVPFICKDRYVWVDDEMQKEGHALTRRWGETAATLGWWDYPWGRTYAIPRIWFHKMADIYRFGYENKVRYIFSETDVTEWIEGPKFYLASRLKWDPYRDVDAILADWYECAVGKKAAPYLANYFAFWEDYWCRRMVSSRWFRQTRRRVYQPPEPATGYIKLLGIRDLWQCEEWLKQAAAAAETDRQKARAELFLGQFRAIREVVEPQLVSAAGMSRLLDLEPLTGERLAFAVDNYLKWQAMHTADSSTAALKLTAALMLERAGRTGAWAKAFAQSPWSGSTCPWLPQFVQARVPLASWIKTVEAAKVSAGPEIDGELDDACWRSAQRVGEFRHFQHNTPLSQPAFAAFCHDRERLYVSFCCLETSPDKLAANIRKHDGPMWEDDSVELFMAPDPVVKPGEFWQFIISVSGAVYDARNGSPQQWTPSIEAKTTVGDRFWAAELAVPLRELGLGSTKPGATLRINVNRSRQVPDLKEIGGWQFVDGRNDNVFTFAQLVLE